MLYFSVPLGKLVRRVSRLRGGGSALPGLVVEKIDPDFMRRTLSTLPLGVAVVSGTNGKTTTTKMVVELLESQGLKVFTNRTGSNFTRGVAAALLGEVDWRGRLQADVAVLELDEAHAVHFVNRVPPRYSLLLNVLRDQLDRFGEIDKTAQLLQHIASKTTGTVVLNREDPRVARIADTLDGREVLYFGLDDSLLSTFPNDDEMRAAPGSPVPPAPAKPHADVVLRRVGPDDADFEYDGETVTTAMLLRGVYNIFNAAAALTLARAIAAANSVPGRSPKEQSPKEQSPKEHSLEKQASAADNSTLLAALSRVAPAFGRGESLVVDGLPLELVLVKNPSGFRLGLKSFPPAGYATMIAINDNYADGRDMSWLWDVEFDTLREGGVDQLTGSRAYDMALRLQYDDVAIGAVNTEIAPALAAFIGGAKDKPKRIFCTYTAMLAIRRELSKITTVEVVS
jgi:UDP-N-acetylmuramyl tripeptide synthase